MLPPTDEIERTILAYTKVLPIPIKFHIVKYESLPIGIYFPIQRNRRILKNNCKKEAENCKNQ